MEVNSQEIRPGLSHMPSFKTQKQQIEEAEMAEVERRWRQPLPTPPSLPTPPVELKMFRTEEDKFGCFRIYYQCPTSELSNTPLPDHNDFAESGETHQACPENIASGLWMPNMLIDGLSSLIGLFTNVTVALFLHEDFEANDL